MYAEGERVTVSSCLRDNLKLVLGGYVDERVDTVAILRYMTRTSGVTGGGGREICRSLNLSIMKVPCQALKSH